MSRRFRTAKGLFEVRSTGDHSTSQELGDLREAYGWAAQVRKSWRDTGAHRVRVVDRLDDRLLAAWDRDFDTNKWTTSTKWAHK